MKYMKLSSVIWGRWQLVLMLLVFQPLASGEIVLNVVFVVERSCWSSNPCMGGKKTSVVYLTI